ncbi:WbuX: N-acetyl sugar amidotransferase [Actinomadura rubteroloni]|uniref:WbuX: N-acetyl sugar amidotransferase n=1 Tax=Actinomadura rubteroloni TaxID=1926885 RepID=A0A2P4UMX0_9ACTN|nr:OzmP [Actinomadura rubteroloni]POM26393.1 WbuX: N-acetyl sugar amidotransferase [Actinomadura rubteroloni]
MASCTVCSLKEGHPGVVLDAQGVCNLCTMNFAEELLDNYRYTSEVFAEFQQAPPASGEFDCLFMYSGGKDSTYMLDKFVNEYGRRVLAYTFDVPFESVHAAQNIALAKEKIPATFVVDSDDDNIKAMMREVFNRPAPKKPGSYLDEKLPCVSCRTFFVLRAILTAHRRKIPYIALCADPQQILTMESNVREIVRGFYRTFGERLTDTLFGGELEEILFADDAELPKIVFPFIATRHEYDPDTIVAELQAKGLYQSSPMETHCTLFPLLNFYSYKNWDCMFYKLNAASHVRAVKRNADHDRNTFSIKFPRSLDLADVEKRLGEVVLSLAADEGDRSEHERTLIDLFQRMDASEDAARFVAGSFLEMRAVAADLGIELN